jgi:hypothetical protein
MATTTNFGWETPDDTDLVKDGAAAIRTALGGVDTSFVDLKGGTTGQILSKASNTDLDYTWVSAAPGDITGVTAGTGISGGGTSGDVTITNAMATAITTNGDLIYGTGSGTFTRRGIGSTGNVLTVSGGVPTWAAPAGWSPNYQLLNAGGTTMSGSNTITISGISGINSLFIRVGGDNLVRNATANATYRLRLNTDSGQNYYWAGITVDHGNTASVSTTTVDSSFNLGNFGATANSSYVISSIQIDGTGTAGIKTISATTGASGGTQTSSQSGSWIGSYNGTSAITSISLVSNGTFSGTGQVFVYGA